MMSAIRKKYLPHYTYDDYKEWKGDWEIIHGIPYSKALTHTIRHQTISGSIARYLYEAIIECEACQALLPVDWKIDDSTVVQPDNLIICHTPTNEAYIKKAPKVIFEILSKSTAVVDKNLKYELYEKEGVSYYIIVDPNESIAKVYELKDGRYIKLCDAYEDSVDFDLNECAFTFDFAKIW